MFQTRRLVGLVSILTLSSLMLSCADGTKQESPLAPSQIAARDAAGASSQTAITIQTIETAEDGELDLVETNELESGLVAKAAATGTIEVTALNPTTKKPVTGAKVTATCKKKAFKAKYKDGKYTITGVPKGLCDVKFEHGDYVTSAKQVTVGSKPVSWKVPTKKKPTVPPKPPKPPEPPPPPPPPEACDLTAYRKANEACDDEYDWKTKTKEWSACYKRALAWYVGDGVTGCVGPFNPKAS